MSANGTSPLYVLAEQSDGSIVSIELTSSATPREGKGTLSSWKDGSKVLDRNVIGERVGRSRLDLRGQDQPLTARILPLWITGNATNAVIAKPCSLAQGVPDVDATRRMAGAAAGAQDAFETATRAARVGSYAVTAAGRIVVLLKGPLVTRVVSLPVSELSGREPRRVAAQECTWESEGRVIGKIRTRPRQVSLKGADLCLESECVPPDPLLTMPFRETFPGVMPAIEKRANDLATHPGTPQEGERP